MRHRILNGLSLKTRNCKLPVGFQYFKNKHRAKSPRKNKQFEDFVLRKMPTKIRPWIFHTGEESFCCLVFLKN